MWLVNEQHYKQMSKLRFDKYTASKYIIFNENISKDSVAPTSIGKISSIYVYLEFPLYIFLLTPYSAYNL